MYYNKLVGILHLNIDISNKVNSNSPTNVNTDS